MTWISICFDCKEISGRMECLSKHRVVELDIDVWEEEKDFIIFVGNRIYAPTISCIDPLNRRYKKIITSPWEDKVIRSRVEFDKVEGVRFAILEEEEWKIIERDAYEMEYVYLIETTRKYLRRITRAKMKDNIVIKNMKKFVMDCVGIFGKKYIDDLVELIRENEELKGKEKEILRILLEDML